MAIAAAETNLIALPDSLGFVPAAALGCRFATAYRAVRAQGRVQPGEWVAVHGCGGVGVGLSAIIIAVASGARVLGVDLSSEALALAERMGVVALSRRGDVASAIREVTDGGAHLSLDAYGSRPPCSPRSRAARSILECSWVG